MIELKYSTVGLRCPVCGKNTNFPVNRFQFAAGTSLLCPGCGATLLNITKSPSSNINLNCFACGKLHQYTISQKNFFSEKSLAFGCKENDIDVLFVGSYRDVDSALFQLDREILQLTDKYYRNIENTYGLYTTSALRILEEKARKNRILCLCGSCEINMTLSKDAVDLICPACGSSEHISVACEEDLTALMERRSILIK